MIVQSISVYICLFWVNFITVNYLKCDCSNTMLMLIFHCCCVLLIPVQFSVYAARLVSGLSRYDYVMPVLRDTLHWLPIGQCIDFRLAVLAFYCVQGTCPSYFHSICTSLTEMSGRVRLHSGHHGDLYVPATRTELGKCSLWVAALVTWNPLMLHLHSFTNRQPRTILGWTRTYLLHDFLTLKTIEEWTNLCPLKFSLFKSYFKLCHRSFCS